MEKPSQRLNKVFLATIAGTKKDLEAEVMGLLSCMSEVGNILDDIEEKYGDSATKGVS